MFNYFLRRLLYAVPIVFGVMVLTFALFFLVQSPKMAAKRNLGPKATPQAVENWLHQRGYDKPRFFNTGPGQKLFDSQFFNHMRSLTTFDLGNSDATGEPVLEKFRKGAIPSLLITVPAFALGIFLSLAISLFMAFVRKSLLDVGGVIACVALMSIPIMVYVIVGQWLIAMQMSWLPAFGFDPSGLTTAKFLLLPLIVYVSAGLGGDVRMYRAIFLEEVHQDYVRTAQAKGASHSRVLFLHVLKNGMISLITLVVASLPFLIMGSLVIENFFGIPGLGSLMIDAIRTLDYAVVNAAVYLGSLLYLSGLLLTDLCYAAVDPRIRFK